MNSLLFCESEINNVTESTIEASLKETWPNQGYHERRGGASVPSPMLLSGPL